MKRAIFLDRDGTLIEDKDYLHRPEDVVIIPGAVAALKRLQDAGFKLFIVTNQSGVGRGYFGLKDVERVHAHLVREFAREGVCFTKIFVAPEAPEEPSRGRKPSPQFIYDARDEFALSLEESYLIGDKLSDLESGSSLLHLYLLWVLSAHLCCAIFRPRAVISILPCSPSV